MKAVILAGGFGTRLQEETQLVPKPMIQIGGKPMLWHIMKIYSGYGINDFVICLGHKGYVIKEYFANYFLHVSDVTLDLSANTVQVHENHAEPWRVTLVDTGEHTMTGGRLKRVLRYVGNEPFCMTYGDGVSNVDLRALIRYHRKQKSLATVTAVHPPARFGAVTFSKSKVLRFQEKPNDGGWINGGFFVIDPRAVRSIRGDRTVWERDTVQQLARQGKLSAYRHQGFWHPMDTLRDKKYLEELWGSGRAPWKVW